MYEIKLNFSNRRIHIPAKKNVDKIVLIFEGISEEIDIDNNLLACNLWIFYVLTIYFTYM